jgi:hypothetical protein
MAEIKHYQVPLLVSTMKKLLTITNSKTVKEALEKAVEHTIRTWEKK